MAPAVLEQGPIKTRQQGMSNGNQSKSSPRNAHGRRREADSLISHPLFSASLPQRLLFQQATKPRFEAGFTLVELLISMAILGVVLGSTILFYTAAADRAEWSAHSLAAESIASQGVEQARAAKWDP